MVSLGLIILVIMILEGPVLDFRGLYVLIKIIVVVFLLP